MTSDYLRYIDSKEWELKRIEKFREAGKRCEACGSSKKIHVHHLTYARLFNERLSDLMVLCEKHHDEIELHYREKRIKKIGKVKKLRAKTFLLLGINYKQKLRNEYISRNANKSFKRHRIDSTQIRIAQLGWIQEALDLKLNMSGFKKLAKQNFGSKDWARNYANAVVVFKMSRQLGGVENFLKWKNIHSVVPVVPKPNVVTILKDILIGQSSY